MYTTVNIMKMNACKTTIKMWKIAQPELNTAPNIVPASPVAAHMPSNRKMISPAYMLPNRRNACESGLEMYSIRLNRKLAGQTSGCAPKGEQNNSCTQPPRPFTLMLKKIISNHTARASAKVALISDVGTARQYLRPNTCSYTHAMMSTGKKSMAFIIKTQTNTVNAVGATNA